MLKFIKYIFAITAILALGTTILQSATENRQLNDLRETNPDQYLKALEEKDDYKWFNALKELKPKDYQLEIAKYEKATQSIPSSEIDKNLDAYRVLSKLEPESDLYLSKVEFYEAELESLKEKRKADKKWDKLCNDSKVEAFQHSKNLVKKSLKSPSTAKLGGYGSTDIKLFKDCEYVVSGHVDAQNGFGAMIRSTYRVHLKRTKSGWDIKDININ